MDTKEKILQTSLELFSRKGYEAVSVSDISGELGITKGALYKHYESKRDILESILRRMEENDTQNALKFHMPEGLFQNMPEKYRNTKLEELCAYTLYMFIYWTQDEFASRFRRLLTIEQYSGEEMNALFQQYLGMGPMSYVEDIMRESFSAEAGIGAKELALNFYGPMFMLIQTADTMPKNTAAKLMKQHIENFFEIIRKGGNIMLYPRSQKYDTPELMSMIMGPNPIKLEEELLEDNLIPEGALVCDLGSGNGLTSVFLAKEYGFKVVAADLWSDPEENMAFFRKMGLDETQISAQKVDATDPDFAPETFDAVVSIDSYNYFGRDRAYLDKKLLPYVKKGGYIYIAVPGMVKDCHDNLPPELLLSWSAEQMDFMHDADYWRDIISASRGIEIVKLEQMRSNEEVWNDWLRQENQYAVGDRKSMEAGAGKYLNFIEIVIRKK